MKPPEVSGLRYTTIVKEMFNCDLDISAGLSFLSMRFHRLPQPLRCQARRSRWRPSFVPTKKMRRDVETLAGFGVPQAGICLLIENPVVRSFCHRPIPYRILCLSRGGMEDHRHRRLLPARRERPRRIGAEQRDELAPLHSITSSATWHT